MDRRSKETQHKEVLWAGGPKDTTQGGPMARKAKLEWYNRKSQRWVQTIGRSRPSDSKIDRGGGLDP